MTPVCTLTIYEAMVRYFPGIRVRLTSHSSCLDRSLLGSVPRKYEGLNELALHLSERHPDAIMCVCIRQMPPVQRGTAVSSCPLRPLLSRACVCTAPRVRRAARRTRTSSSRRPLR